MRDGAGPTGTAVAVDLSRDETVIAQGEERPARRLTCPVATGVTAASALIAASVLCQVFWPLAQGNQFSLILFLASTLPLVFLCYRSGVRLGRRGRPGPDNPTVADCTLAALAVAVCLYPVLPVTLGAGGGGFDAFLDRQGILAAPDVLAGGVLLLLVLEACRRTTGGVLPAVCLLFLAYSYYGGLVPQSWSIAHQGLNFDEIVNALYNDASGFYGVPLDVAASYIVLFAIYAALLDLSGAGRFFVELSLAATGTARALTDNPTGTLIATAVLAAVAVALLGLAVPVTASFIIAWVIIGPALQNLGVTPPEAAMFRPVWTG